MTSLADALEPYALALLYLKLGLVQPADFAGDLGAEALAEVLAAGRRAAAARSGDRLAEEARAHLRGALLHEAAPPRRRRLRRAGKRVFGVLIGQLLVFSIHFGLAVALLVAIRLRWPEFDLAELAARLRALWPF